MLAVIDLFAGDVALRTVEDIAARLGYTRATAYRYVGELCDAGLLMRVAQGAYALGPRVIELDRHIRHHDPLLEAGEKVMHRLLAPDRGQVVLLCSLFRDRVLCTHQMSEGSALALSYTRGRPMPLFRGATSKAILAWLPPRRLARLYEENRAEIARARLGRTREEFLAALKAIRRQGYAVTRAEVDPGVIGIGVPLAGGDRSVIGSLSIVFPRERYPERNEARVAAALRGAAQAIGEELSRLARPATRGSRARS
jgi:DNA-binding IclR family transcriptional regulator